jgi:hypothetical protein
MARNENEGCAERYADLGGLHAVVQKYEQNDITLSEVAVMVGCSGATVRNDFIRKLGVERYTLLQQNRKKIVSNMRELDASDLRKVFTQRLETLPLVEAQKIQALIDVIEQAEQAHVPLKAIEREGDNIRFFLPNERTVKMRIALLTESRPEHRLGLHRFRVSPGITKYDFVFFAMQNDNTTIYIFKSAEIAHVQSLALRYKWFNRKSRYDYARDRWSILHN